MTKRCCFHILALMFIGMLLFTYNMYVFGAQTQDIVQYAKAETAKRSKIQKEWYGPTSGPKAISGKKIACINADSKNPIEKLWGDCVAIAAKRIGWEVTIFDGKGTVAGWTTALNQAIALNVDGIVMSCNAEPLQVPITEARKKGIFLVGIHASDLPGPAPKVQLFYNCTSDPGEIGRALADAIIADSNGKGRAVIIYNSLYAIARHKAEAMRDELAKAKGCQLLEYLNCPETEITTLMPQTTTKWVQKYKKPVYVMAITDWYYDFVVPTLRTGQVPVKDIRLLGSDGTPKAYERIKNNEYQTVTIPEPSLLFGYQAVDELNRAFSGEEAYVWNQPVYLVTKANYLKEGGDKTTFNPSNNFEQRFAEIWGVK
jgi:ribose transport system substrate-binding protein